MTDRRAFLAAVPALAVLTAGPALATALPLGVVTNDPGLQQAIATYRETGRQSELYHDTVYAPAQKHYEALCAAIPHRITRQTLPGRTEGFSTADEGAVAIARACRGKAFRGWPR
jgi:hypothetical protein